MKKFDIQLIGYNKNQVEKVISELTSRIAVQDGDIKYLKNQLKTTEEPQKFQDEIKELSEIIICCDNIDLYN